MTPGFQWRQIENAFVSLIKEAVGLEAVWGWAKGVQPTRPFVRLSWLNFDSVNNSGYSEEYNAVTKKVEKNYYSARTGQVDVQVITDDLRAGENSLTYADAIMVAFDIADITTKWLAPVGVAVANYGGARPLDAVEDGAKPVSRTSFILYLNMAANSAGAVTPGSIKTVETTGQVENDAGTDLGGPLTVTGS